MFAQDAGRSVEEGQKGEETREREREREREGKRDEKKQRVCVCAKVNEACVCARACVRADVRKEVGVGGVSICGGPVR